MTGRNEKIYEEAAALWRSVHGEPPPKGVDGTKLLALVLGDLPDASYSKLNTPYLRPANICFPKT